MQTEQMSLITPKWILTLENDDLLENHSLLIDQHIIKDILPTTDARETYPSTKEIELPNQLLMPGFVNCHGHAAMNLFKGLADDLPLMTWLEKHIWPAEGQWVSEEFVKDGTKLAIAEMLKSGTTCFSDMYFFPEQAADVAAEYGMRGVFYGPVMDFPTPYGSGPDEYIEKIIKAHDHFKHHPLIDIGFGPHAPYTVSDEPIKQVRALADQLNMPIQIHLHETEFEVIDAVEKTGHRPSERLRDLGLFGEDVQAVHVTQANQTDMDIFHKYGVHVIHCPESNLKLASGFCPIYALQQNGVNVALGTDGSASNNDLDMMGEMHTAALLAKAVAQNASAIPALEAVKMATINGAKALGKETEIGSLKVGKQADIISIDFNDIACTPVYDPISHLVYSSSRSQVDHVWVAGKLQVKNKQLCHFNVQQLMDMSQSWAEKIQASK
ncbi:TRZ/ATZ family hydrolase [Oceaniserpentilla sp. 4NH20-0058]|uniref:TRZ/ATZ family hydrolase n=1 Tax=Oceaniserpentilla sp. 4NH20-0058 TaxID=3127660 RepID=UPI0031021512